MSKKQHKTTHKNADRPFRIKHNILTGDENPLREEHVGDMILAALKSTPDFIGQVDAVTGRETTFQEMREKSVKCALWLKKAGIVDGSVIAICTTNVIDAYVPLLASMYIHAVANVWEEDYIHNTIRLLYFLTSNTPDVIFADAKNVPLIFVSISYLQSCNNSHITPKIIVFDNTEKYENMQLIWNCDFDTAEIDEFSCRPLNCTKDTAVMMFSSNAVSFPGEAQIPYLAFTSPSNQETPVMIPNDVGLWYGSLCWTHSLLLTIRAILARVKVIRCMEFDEESMYQTIEKYKVTWVFLKSNMCTQFINMDDLGQYDLSSLERILFGDFSIRREIHEDFIKYFPYVSITQVYAMSETGVLAYQRSTGKIKSSGYVGKNNKLMFVDLITRKQLGPNTRGEIWCKTPCMLSACDELKATESNSDMNRWYNGWYYTGDIGYYDADGDIFVVDKAKNFIKCRNHHVAAIEIEELLEQHPAVLSVVVLAVPHSNDGERAMAYIQKVPGETITEEDLMEFVADNLPRECRLRGGVQFVSTEMPRLPNGMIDRNRVRQMRTEI